MDFSIIHSAWTLFVALVFVAIAAWAYWPSHKDDMEAAGRSILEGDDDAASGGKPL